MSAPAFTFASQICLRSIEGTAGPLHADHPPQGDERPRQGFVLLIDELVDAMQLAQIFRLVEELFKPASD